MYIKNAGCLLVGLSCAFISFHSALYNIKLLITRREKENDERNEEQTEKAMENATTTPMITNESDLYVGTFKRLHKHTQSRFCDVDEENRTGKKFEKLQIAMNENSKFHCFLFLLFRSVAFSFHWAALVVLLF